MNEKNRNEMERSALRVAARRERREDKRTLVENLVTAKMND
jgi:hypothetical protein